MSDDFDPFGGPRPGGPPGAEGWDRPTPAPPAAVPAPPAPWAGAPATAAPTWPPPAAAPTWPPATGGPPPGGPVPGGPAPWGHPSPGAYLAAGAGGPAAPPPPPAPPTRPQSIVIAVWLMYTGAVLSVLGGLLGFTQQDELRDELERELNRQGSNLDVDTLLQIALVAALAGALVGTALWILNAVFCGRGANWSRILGSIFYTIQLAGSAISLAQPAPALSRVAGLVTLAVATGAVVLLWVPTSNRFFSDTEAARRRW